MKRNGSKTKELQSGQKYYRIEYKSEVDGDYYWHKAVGKNKEEAKEDFKEAIEEKWVSEIQEPIVL